MYRRFVQVIGFSLQLMSILVAILSFAGIEWLFCRFVVDLLPFVSTFVGLLTLHVSIQSRNLSGGEGPEWGPIRLQKLDTR